MQGDTGYRGKYLKGMFTIKKSLIVSGCYLFVLLLLNCSGPADRPSIDKIEYLGQNGTGLYFHLRIIKPDKDFYTGNLLIYVDAGEETTSESSGNYYYLYKNTLNFFSNSIIVSDDPTVADLFLRINSDDLGISRDLLSDGTKISLKFFIEDKDGIMSNQAYVNLKLIYR